MRLVILTFVLLGTLPSVLHAQGAGIEWEILNQEVVELHRAGNYDRVVLVAQKALQVAEQNVGPDHPDVATTLNNLALLYDNQGDPAKAEPLYERSLAISQKALGPDHPDVAGSLNNLAELYRTQGNFARAEPLYERALEIWEKALGPDHSSVATVLENLAALYRATKRGNEAESLEQRAANIRAMRR
jgi:tetratricopeptide (TPR) repeat protein